MMEKSYKEIEDNIKLIFENINNNLPQNVNINDIDIVAVTKNHSAESVNNSIKCGIKSIGENRVQEYLSKFDNYIEKEKINKYFIGHLQTNKVSKIIDKVDLIQSVDSINLAKEINRHAKNNNLKMPILVEINIGNEISKSGLDINALEDFLINISAYKNIEVKGLMCIPPDILDTVKLESYFDKMYDTFIDIKGKKLDNIKMDILSMGMTNDYFLAVKHGSNMVRIGRGIFGERL